MDTKRTRTVDYLPEIFQTPTNKQFLSATLDVLTQQSTLQRVQGFIGDKYGYGVVARDIYVPEPTKTRSNYQLNPSVVFLKPETQTASDFIDYPGIVQALKNEGAITDDQQRMFEQEFYSWEPFIDMDKMVNYTEYFWIPQGPDSVLINPTPIPTNQTIMVTRGETGYSFSNLNTTDPDQPITLVRGGTYRFVVNQAEKFWLQGTPGLTGRIPFTTVDTREIYGVENNGETVGIIEFTVPAKDAQASINKSGDTEVDVLSTIAFADIDGQPYNPDDPLKIDGVAIAPGQRILFYGENATADAQSYIWTVTLDVSDNIVLSNGIEPSNPAGDIIYSDTKITVKYGDLNAGQSYYKDGETYLITRIPYISSFLDTIYYQDGTNADFYGQINFIADNASNYIDVNQIIGRTQYVSPNGVAFVNGLKIRFDANVIPTTYAEKEYYVEGVGTSIVLLPVTEFQIPETQNYATAYRTEEALWDFYYDPLSQTDTRNEGWSKLAWSGTKTIVGTDIDYITISRNSRDYNGWSRTNRWFHQDVIDTAIAQNGYVSNTVNNVATRASRPIIEYYGNLSLFNNGRTLGGVDFVSDQNINAFTTVQNAPITGYGIESITKGTVNNPTVVTLKAPAIYASDATPVFQNGVKVIFTEIKGMTQLNLVSCWIKTTDNLNFQLYTDPELTQGLDSTGFNNYESGGSIQYDFYVDGVQPADNGRILFIDDPDEVVRKTVYVVSYLPNPKDPTTQIISLNSAAGISITDGDEVYVFGGNTNGGKSYIYNDTTKSWSEAQYKKSLNQYPLFDLFDINGYSLSDALVYPATTFVGSYLFSYTPGTGADDPVLGFPIKYSTFTSTGDINFTVNYNYDTFTYYVGTTPKTTNVNLVGYVHYSPTVGTVQELNGWVNAAAPSVQYQVLQFQVPEFFSKISNISNTDPVTVTTVEEHYFINGTPVVIEDAYGLTELNGNPYFAKVIDVTTVELYLDADLQNPVDAREFNRYAAGGVLSIRGQYKFVCDVPANNETPWATLQVYRSDTLLSNTDYQFSVNAVAGTTTVTLNEIADPQQKVTVLLISDRVSSSGYYENPTNLQNNPFNEIVNNLDLGDIRNHYLSIYANAPNISGPAFGNNNIHNSANLNNYGTQIVQNSASLVLPGVFTRKAQLNLFSALQYSSDQYYNYKQLIVDLTANGPYTTQNSAAEILDDVISDIGTTKTTKSFFWSDMLPNGNPYRVNTYFQEQATNQVVISLSQTYDYTKANYNGLCVYLRRSQNNPTLDIQLIRGADYVVSDISPTVTINYDIAAGQSIIVKEYNQTYGSYCPNTPTKLGMFGIYRPEVVYDTTYNPATWFIQGHDGSYTKLYGTYDSVAKTFSDFRDSVIFEFESRVYNNLKLDGFINPLVAEQVIPGQFRTTDYTNNEILQIYTKNFLNWVGANRVDYKEQVYQASNEFTYNYNRSQNKLDNPDLTSNTALKQGYWRGIYRWFYDTDEPNLRPWEMLGFDTAPDWWNTYYGSGPYTSTNTLLWDDLAAGRVWNNGDPYINPLYVRPRLSEVIPVDSVGNLLSPLAVVVNDYDTLSFQRSWIVGDQAPVESSYIKSSTWPFDLVRILALTKPAQFFNYFADADDYRYSTSQQQFLFNDHTHLDPRLLSVYGDGTATTSYINWIVDYAYLTGIDAYTTVKQTLENLDVRLTYRLAGFSDKTYLKFLVEKATPNDTNNSLLIPDDSYQVLLYDNVPDDQIVYSGIIVQKLDRGWSVSGFSQNNPYFTIAVPKSNGTNRTQTVNGTTVVLSGDYYVNPPRTAIVPYGTVFYSVQGLSEFIQSYGYYLTLQGIGYDPEVGESTTDWELMIERFIDWTQQSWEIGSVITLNPLAEVLSVNAMDKVVQPLTLHQQNFILNQNIVPITQQNLAVVREGTAFSARTLNSGDAISYTNLNLHTIEHAVIFDNYTVFNDTIYNLLTGLRQSRLLMQAEITAEWRGYVNAQGFILNQDNIQDWAPNTKYTKGQIVKAKGFYWVADAVLNPTTTFNENDWTKSNSNQIQLGILPNPSTQAAEATLFYDINNANLEEDSDLLSFSLIGFRPRPYMSAADLTGITQVNVYKNILNQKGTNLLANSFKSAEFAQGRLEYDLREVWALKNATFGSVLNSNYVELLLNQNLLNSNPSTVGFSTGEEVAVVEQTVLISELLNYERKPLRADFLPRNTTNYTQERGLPSAGYVNINDSKINVFSPANLNDIDTNYTTLYRKNNVWIANYQGDWGIFAPDSVDSQVVRVVNNLNNTITIHFNGPHGMVANDIFVVLDFNVQINRYYTVNSVSSVSSVTVVYALDQSVNELLGYGFAMKLVTQRAAQPSDIGAARVQWSEFYTSLYWVDADTDADWSVYEKSPVFAGSPIELVFTPPTPTPTITNYGTAVLTNGWLGTVVSGIVNGVGAVFRVKDGITQRIPQPSPAPTFGKGLAASDTRLFVADDFIVWMFTLDDNTGLLRVSPNPNYLYYPNNGQIAVSKDGDWLYIASSTSPEIAIYGRNQFGQYVVSNTITGPANAGFGSSISTSIDGRHLFVGAPTDTAGVITRAGAVYCYARGYNRWETDGNIASFSLSAMPNNPLTMKVIVNGIATTAYSYENGTITFTNPPTTGSVVEAEYDSIINTAKITNETPEANDGFGISVSTNRYGSDLVIGSPYETNRVNGVNNVEGAAHVYMNSGQHYGSVVSTRLDPSVSTYDRLLINGYQVLFVSASGVGAAANIAQQINDQTPTNILASVDTHGYLTIGVITGTAEVAYDVIDVVAEQYIYTNLGFAPYTKTQTITSPLISYTGGAFNDTTTQFGSLVVMNETNGLVIGAPTASDYQEATFDFSDDFVDNDTIFDNGSTIFVDSYLNSGAVYEFQYLPAYNESITNPGQYVFGQPLSIDLNSTELAVQPRYGQRLSFSGTTILVGSPSLYTNGNGSAYIFDGNGQSTWSVNKHATPTVDINKLNYISVYDTTDNTTLDYLDYIDPVQGKLLGAVFSNLDYWQTTDPAGYGQTTVSWGEEEVGRTWLDTSNIRILNYHQPDLAYNAKYWAQPFPGSTADVYTWINSTQAPLDYTGPGYLTNFDNYVEIQTLDEATNSLVTTYYYWVKNYTLVPRGKTISPLTVAQYILNPKSSGIAYLAPLNTSSVGLYNVSDYLNGLYTALHIGYAAGENTDQATQSWTLINDNQATSFLSGLPRELTDVPSGQYLKLLDSFSGYDTAEIPQEVPQPDLPPLLRYGVSVRPRQSMLPNRENALNDYLTWVNNLLTEYAVGETRTLGFLNSSGYYTTPISNVTNSNPAVVTTTRAHQLFNGDVVHIDGVVGMTQLNGQDFYAKTTGYSSTTLGLYLDAGLTIPFNTSDRNIYTPYVSGGILGKPWDTRDYWSYSNWWAEGYSNSTKPDVEVPYIVGLYSVAPFQGIIARVTSNYQGVGETFRWTVETGWYRIGLDNGTLQFNSTLWTQPALITNQPIRNIIRWINEQLFTQDLDSYKNRGLMLLFNIITSDAQQSGNYLPWLNKTSFIDVQQTVRRLLAYKKYQRDNTQFLEGYLNEIKPYHVVIKDFLFRYTGIDTYGGSITDYDVPSLYNPNFERFISPRLIYTGIPEIGEYLPDATIWTTSAYMDWFQNYGLSISSTELSNVAVTTTAAAITDATTAILVTSVYGMPEQGIITVNAEKIKYGSVDRYYGTLGNLIRGFNGTEVTDHPINSSVVMDLPAAIVLDTGRAYLNPPQITVSIDTSLYPAPREVAQLQAIMGDPFLDPPEDPSKVYSITVVNGGSGYAIKPTIYIEPSIVVSFTTVDIETNVITLDEPTLQTGDSVVFRGNDATSPVNLVNEQYYYVRTVECDLALPTWVSRNTYVVGDVVKYRSDTNQPFQQYTCIIGNNDVTFTPDNWLQTMYVRLFNTYYDSITPAVPAWASIPTEADASINSVVYITGDIVQYNGYTYECQVPSTNSITFDTAQWVNLGIARYSALAQPVELGSRGSGTLNLTPRISTFTTNQPVREIKTKIKFDRTTYTSKIVPWIASQETTLVSAINATTRTLELDDAASFPPVGTIRLPGGVVTVLSTDASTDTITLNDVTYIRVGDPIVFVDVTGYPAYGNLATGVTYYILSVDTDYDTITISTSPGGEILDLLSGTGTIYAQLTEEEIAYDYINLGTNVMLNVIRGANGTLAQPHAADSIVNTIYNPGDLVLYPPNDSRRLYRCLVENIDSTFDYNNWVQILSDDPSLSAADRIVAFYRPTINMPGVDLTQLMTGVEYPNNTYFGEPMGSTREWDASDWEEGRWENNNTASRTETNLRSPGFDNLPYAPFNPTVVGTPFNYGYGPEELIPGLTYDNIDINVYTKPGSTWNPLTVINNSGDDPLATRTPVFLGTRGIVTISEGVSIVQDGRSMYFDSVADYLKSPYATQFDFVNQDFTIEFWMFTSVLQDAQIITTAQLNTPNGWSVGITDDRRITFISSDGVTGLTTWTTVPIEVFELEEWVNVSLVRTDDNLTVYVGTAGQLNTAYRMVPSITIVDITQASPGVVTLSGSAQIFDGQQIKLIEIGGMTQVNNNIYYAKRSGYGGEEFGLYYDEELTDPVNTAPFTAYTSGGIAIQLDANEFVNQNPIVSSYDITGITNTDPGVMVLDITTYRHLTDGQRILVQGVEGMTELNGNYYYVKETIYLNQIDLYEDEALTIPLDTTAFNAYTGGGTITVETNMLIGQGLSIGFDVIPLFIGPVQPVKGFIQELRVSNVARYSEQYYPATVAFNNDSDTLLLVHPTGLANSDIIVDDVGTTIDATGFNIVRRDVAASIDVDIPVSFDGIVTNPIGLDVYVYELSGTGRTGTNYQLPATKAEIEYEQNYVIDWVNKQIVFTNPALNGLSIQLAVYELGGGNQIARSNTDDTPLLNIEYNDNTISVLDIDAEYDQFILPAPVTNGGTTVVVYASDTTLISSITKSAIAVVTTATAHNLSDGDQVLLSGVQGMSQVNGNAYFAKVTDYSSTTFALYTDVSLTMAVNSLTFGSYVTNTDGQHGVVIKRNNVGLTKLAYNTDYFVERGVDGITTRIRFSTDRTDQYIAYTLIGWVQTQFAPATDIPVGTMTINLSNAALAAYTLTVGDLITFDSDNSQYQIGSITSTSVTLTQPTNQLVPAGARLWYYTPNEGYSAPIKQEIFVENPAVVTYPLANFIEPGANEGDIIVQLNNTRLTPLTDYTIAQSGGVTLLTVSPTLDLYDVISVTSFVRLAEQSLATQVIDDLTVSMVSAIDYSPNTTTPVVVTTSANHNLTGMTLIKIDGLDLLTTPLNGNYYWAKALTTTTLELYYDETEFEPVILGYNIEYNPTFFGINVSYLFDADQLMLDQPNYFNLLNTDRLWVSINGKYINTNLFKLSINADHNVTTSMTNGNELSIFYPIVPGDVVIITSVTPLASPNEESFLISVDYTNTPRLFRTDWDTRTYLTQEYDNLTPAPSDALYVNDVYRLLDINTEIRRFNNNYVTLDTRIDTSDGTTVILKGDSAPEVTAILDKYLSLGVTGTPVTFDLNTAILDISSASTAVVTLGSTSNFTTGQAVILYDVQGFIPSTVTPDTVSPVNGVVLYIDVLNDTEIALYRNSARTTPFDSTGYSDFISLGTVAVINQVYYVNSYATVADKVELTMASTLPPNQRIGGSAMRVLVARSRFEVQQLPALKNLEVDGIPDDKVTQISHSNNICEVWLTYPAYPQGQYDVTTYVGDTILVNGEYIIFRNYNRTDLNNQYIYGLQRGFNKTVVNTFLPPNTDVISILDRNKMQDGYYNRTWYDYTNTPLQINDSAPAVFLRTPTI